jgi:hypothetical protein
LSFGHTPKPPSQGCFEKHEQFLLFNFEFLIFIVPAQDNFLRLDSTSFLRKTQSILRSSPTTKDEYERLLEMKITTAKFLLKTLYFTH